MTLVFSHAMLLSYRGADNELAGRQAEAAILGAEKYAETILAQAQTANVLPDRANYQNAAVPLGDAFFWFIGEPLASAPPNVPAFALVDEASKININAAPVNAIALLPNMTVDLAQAISAWHSTNGGGGIQLNTVKGAPYESPEELALVDGGIDPSVLYGNDTNLNHCVDPEEGSNASGGTGGGALDQFNPGLLEYVTTFSREPNTLSDGTKRANVLNGIGGLRATLSTVLGSARAQQIGRIFAGPPGSPAPRIYNVMDFCSRAQLTPDEWDKITPYLTMSSGTYCVGLVNVNTASATVLSCLPSMTVDLANQIVTARAQQSTPSTNLQWVATLLPSNVRQDAGRWMTTRSYQVSADIAAVGRNGRGYRRTLFVIDSSAMPITGATTPQIVYRRNLSSLGWALGSDARTTLPTAANIAAGTAKAGTTPSPKGGVTP